MIRPTVKQLQAEAGLAALVQRRFRIDVFDGGVTTFEQRREKFRSVIGSAASQRATQTQTFGEIFEGIYRQPLLPNAAPATTTQGD